VTGFAALPLWTFLLPRFRSPVRSVIETIRLRRMARLTGLPSYVQGRIGWLVDRILLMLVG
jgi:hypothetical protein